MKKKIFVALLLLMLPVGAFAGNKLKNNQFVSVPAGETVEGNYYAAGNRIDIAGDVDGDVIVAGWLVDITGNVAGDVIAAAGSVRISGVVQGDIRVAGETITVDSVIGKNATIAGGAVFLSEDSAIGESLLAAGGVVDMKGKVEDNARVAAGQLVIAGSVGDDVYAKVDEVDQFVIQQGAVIGGDLMYSAPSAANVLSGATIQGEVDYKALTKKMKKESQAAIPIFGFFLGLALLYKFSIWLGMVFLGLLIIHFMPKAVEMINKEATRNFWPSLGWGALFLVLGPVLTIVLFSTLILWPIAVTVMLLYALYLIYGFIQASTFLGEWILKKVQKRNLRGVSLRWSLVLGVTVLMVVSLIPVLGWLFKCLAIATAIGASKVIEMKELKRYQ